MLPHLSAKQTLLLLLSFVVHFSPAKSRATESRLNNGLAITPPMGWNSYNHYGCFPNESIVYSNAQALVDLGLQTRGYHYVTVDCGWSLPNRTSEGKLSWDPILFPSGYPALGNYLHELGLSFGVYSDAGIKMCGLAEAASLFHERIDAETFAEWGADLLKYDNCYSTASKGYPEVDPTPPVSPSGRFAKMSEAFGNIPRPILFAICEWGVDFPSAWAPKLGQSWRVADDIGNDWSSIFRILNQVVPQTSFAGPGQWLDLDMLEVGNGVLTVPEEQTHFSLWSIVKSPLVIGAPLNDTQTSINTNSLDTLANQDVIGYNQDFLGIAASFRRRWTAEGYEVWAGDLSGGRMVVALVNWRNFSRTLTLDLPVVGIQKVGAVKDIWNDVVSSNVLTSYTAQVRAHGTILVELTNKTTAAGTYDVSDATISGQTTTFSNIYGSTTSASYSGIFKLQTTSFNRTTVIINKVPYIIPANTDTLIATLNLSAINNNTVEITSSLNLSSLTITEPSSTFYPAPSFTTIGDAVHVTCTKNYCAPVGAKIAHLSSTGKARITIQSPDNTIAGSKYVGVIYCNNGVDFDGGTNTRMLPIAVNDVKTQVEVPLSGRTSELFGVADGWEDSAVFEVLVDGWQVGNNEVVIGMGLTSYGADFVGLNVRW